MTAPLDLAAIRARALKAHAWNASLRRRNADVPKLAADVTALCDEVERLRVERVAHEGCIEENADAHENRIKAAARRSR